MKLKLYDWVSRIHLCRSKPHQVRPRPSIIGWNVLHILIRGYAPTYHCLKTGFSAFCFLKISRIYRFCLSGLNCSKTWMCQEKKHFSCLISSQVRYIGIWICHFKMVWWFFGSLGLNKAVTFCSCFRSLQGPLLKVQSAAKLVGGFCVLKTRCPSSSQVNRQVKWAVFVLKMHGEEMSNFRCFGCEKERSLTKKFPGFLHSCQDYLEHIVWLVLWTNTCRLTHCGTMPFRRT